MALFDWLFAKLPKPARGPRAEPLVRVIAGHLDELVDRAKVAAKVDLPSEAPDDALPHVGRDRGIERMPGEAVETWRTRVEAAWQTWGFAATTRGVREPLVLFGLRGVMVVPNRVWCWDERADLWARFRVYVTGYASSGELLSGAFMSGAYLGPGLSIVPLISGTFVSGASVSGTLTPVATVEAVRELVRTWSPARDRCVAVTFTWGGAISGAFFSGTTNSGGPTDFVSWRGTPHFV